jgi:PAS domain S-box-containing protein
MTVLPEQTRSPAQPTATRPATPPPTAPPRFWRPWHGKEWLLGGAGLLLLLLAHPLTWNSPPPWVWFPPAGIALVLVACLGGRAGFLVAAAGLLAALAARLWPQPNPPGLSAASALPAGAADAVLLALEATVTWWCYRRAAGSPGLADPRSAVVFWLLAPGLAAAGFAVLRALPPWAVGAAGDYWPTVLQFWVGDALGILVLAPPALVLLPPLLIRRGWLDPGPEKPRLQYAHGELLSRGSRFEVLGLALLAGAYALLLLLVRGQRELASWQLWGVPLLLIVWACLRQGLRGGPLVASAAALVPLAVAPWLWPPEQALSWWRGDLIVQCSTALLVAASAGWIQASEARYRRIVGHIPVVLYSARILALPGTPRPLTPPGPLPAGSEVPAPPLPHQRPTPPQGSRRPWSVEAEVTFVSPACRELLGCDAEELLGDYGHWLRRVDSRDREVLLAAVNQLGRQQQPVTCEYRLQRQPRIEDRGSKSEEDKNPSADPRSSILDPRSSALWVRDTLAPHFDDGGRLTGWEGVLTDITAQRTLADDLRRTTSMLHALVANLPAGVFFVHGTTGRPILVNARARQLLGRREDSGAGLDHLVHVYRLERPDGSLYPVEELPVALALRRGLTTMRDDIVVHRPDGRRLPLVTWAAPLDLSGQGTHDAAVWVFEDLSALRQAEAAHHETENRLRAVIETMAEGLIVQDAAGVIVECNPAACAILGLSADELRGRSSFDPSWACVHQDGSPFPPEEHPAMVSLRTGRSVRNVIMGIPREPARIEARGSRLEEDNSSSREPRASSLEPRSFVRWILVNSMPLGVARGKPPARVVTTFADITAHLETLEGLRSSEERYRGLVETLPLALLQFDRNLRLSYVNPATEALTGYRPDELAEPAGWQALVHPEDLPRLLAALGEGGPETCKLEVRLRPRDGSDKIGFTILQRQPAGCGTGVITALVVDVTRERHLEQELLRSQRVELVGRLAGGIAHDFNNLLTVILSFAHMARAKLPADHPARKDLYAITTAADQAANLAGQLLTFGKQRRRAPRRVDVNQIVRHTLDLVRSTLPETIEVAARFGPEELPVLGDETQLQQVVMNLCLNARDAMPAGGRLTVQTAVAAEAAGRWVQLSVGDTGEGMSDEVRERIFVPFFSTKERGTGLGLAVVQQIVEAHGGRIDVHTRQGEGSCFEVRVPLAEG